MTPKRMTTGRLCPGCGAAETGLYPAGPPWKWTEFSVEHKKDCDGGGDGPVDCEGWDKLAKSGNRPKCNRPFGPRREGSRLCRSGSLASGGQREYCTCDTCF